MPTLPKLPPSSLRPDPSLLGNRTARSAEARPYLVSGSPIRRNVSVAGATLKIERSITLFPHESEDARLTGSTRSLFRRLLALNLPVSAGETGSFSTKTTKTKIASA